jgi:hypothetical protein
MESRRGTNEGGERDGGGMKERIEAEIREYG